YRIELEHQTTATKNFRSTLSLRVLFQIVLVKLSLSLGGSCPVRAAYDYQNETHDEKCCKGRVVEQTIDRQQCRPYDEKETRDSNELGERSHRDSRNNILSRIVEPNGSESTVYPNVGENA